MWRNTIENCGNKNTIGRVNENISVISNALNVDKERCYAEPTVVSKDMWKQLHNNVTYKHTKNISLCPS